jgi:predicted nucleic acid-binding protein
MIFDTDIFIWIQRGNERAAELIDRSDLRYLSVFTYMELLQGAKNKTQHKTIKDLRVKVFRPQLEENGGLGND